jgi:two-component system, LuxR family, sensor kinase FixL
MTAAACQISKATSKNAPAKGLIRTFERRYFFVLAAVACLVVLDQAVVQPLLVQMNAYAPAINVAGRQRMLSQRLTKAALKLQIADSVEAREASRQELEATRHEWAGAHFPLESGPGKLSILALHAPPIDSAWSELQPHFGEMNEAAKAIAEGEPATERSTDLRQHISNIVDHEAAYLSAMDRVVKLLELEAAKQIRFLRVSAMGIAATVLVLLLALGWLVVRPAANVISGQVNELELRVDQRTRELANANSSLEQEISDHAAADEKTQLLAAQLAHAARVSTMGHLTAGLSHELNQPLAAIVNYAETCELLLDHANSDRGKLRQHFEQIKQASARAGKILHRMRDFVRPTRTTLAKVDLNELVQEVVELCKFDADRANVQTTLELGSSTNVAVDAVQIQQVLVNLLQNALQAIKARDANMRRVTIRTEQVDDEVRVEVIDTGPGLDTMDEVAIFSPFYTTKTNGLGLGLAISKTIVERHHGAMMARNSPHGGAIIGFTLPCTDESPHEEGRGLTEANCLTTETTAC